MSNFGFKRPAGATGEPSGLPLDVSGLPSGPVALDPQRERDAVARGEQMGFTDRGQGRAGRRKRPPAPPSQTIYIRAPQELAEWFERYTERRGHRALWQSIQDFRDMIDAADNHHGGSNGEANG
jgi:hypothetical protein